MFSAQNNNSSSSTPVPVPPPPKPLAPAPTAAHMVVAPDPATKGTSGFGAKLKNISLPPVVSGKFAISSILQGHRGRLLIPVILIVGTMLVAGYFLPKLWRPSTPAVVETPEPTLTPATPVPTATPDPYRDWKAYTNRTAELSFKYPSALGLKEEKINGVGFIVSLSKTATESGALIKIISSTQTQAELVNTYVGGGAAVPADNQTDIEISGIVGHQGDYVFPGQGEGIPLHYATIARDPTTFLFINLGAEKEVFDKLVLSVRLVTPGITPDWQTYSNTLGSYSLRYPPTWTVVGGDATASAQTVSVRKNAEEPKFQSITLDSSIQTGKQKIDLTASEIISSLQNLAGWKDTPSLDFRSIGGGQAQIVSGERDGSWEIYAVVWYRNTLLQLTWKDTLLRPEQNTFDDILGSIQFK